jgi:hypothetical protein
MAGASAVRHDAGATRFVLEEDGQEADLLYRFCADRLILIHTEVPEAAAASAPDWSVPRSRTREPSS